MSDSFADKKAKFITPVHQSAWMLKISKKISTQRMVTICKCTDRTIRGWKIGKTMMPYQSLIALAKEANVDIPKVEQIARYAHTRSAGLLGSAAVMKKYGKIPINEQLRKARWQHWFENGGREKISKNFTKSIMLPKISMELAEFIGIMLGDGGMTKFQITVTLHSVDDYAYSIYIKKIIKRLFGVEPRIYKRKDHNVINLVLSRKKVVDYLYSLGLVIGNKTKQKIGIPTWVLKNESYSLACMRGLMDTDGSVYVHKYKVNGKDYEYKKLCFSSASEQLRHDVQFILHRFGIRATTSGTNVRIDAISDIERYMKLFGSNNPKHLKRYTK